MLVFIMIECVGSELRNPFENQINDTPMSALCLVIERDLRQLLDQDELPPAAQAVDGVLM